MCGWLVAVGREDVSLYPVPSLSNLRFVSAVLSNLSHTASETDTWHSRVIGQLRLKFSQWQARRLIDDYQLVRKAS